MRLLDRPCWIFDMDGTLTVAMHDFAAFKETHGLPVDEPILEVVETMEPARGQEILDALDRWEADLADRAHAAPGAHALLDALRDRGCRLGVLTRNTRDNAWRTLAAADLDRYFARDDVLGRDDAAPKPSPEGIRRLLDRWACSPDRAVVVGDFVFDMDAGRAAGAGTVYVDLQRSLPEGPMDDGLADLAVHGLDRLVPPVRPEGAPTSRID